MSAGDIHRIHKWRTRRKKLVTSHESEALRGKQKLQMKTFSELAECLARIQRQTSLALTVATTPYICRLFLFFLPPRFVYISVSPNCSELAFVFGFSEKFASFLRHRPLVELLMLRKPTKSSCFLEDIRVPFDCKQQIATKH